MMRTPQQQPSQNSASSSLPPHTPGIPLRPSQLQHLQQMFPATFNPTPLASPLGSTQRLPGTPAQNPALNRGPLVPPPLLTFSPSQNSQPPLTPPSGLGFSQQCSSGTTQNSSTLAHLNGPSGHVLPAQNSGFFPHHTQVPDAENSQNPATLEPVPPVINNVLPNVGTVHCTTCDCLMQCVSRTTRPNGCHRCHHFLLAHPDKQAACRKGECEPCTCLATCPTGWLSQKEAHKDDPKTRKKAAQARCTFTQTDMSKTFSSNGLDLAESTTFFNSLLEKANEAVQTYKAKEETWLQHYNKAFQIDLTEETKKKKKAETQPETENPQPFKKQKVYIDESFDNMREEELRARAEVITNEWRLLKRRSLVLSFLFDKLDDFPPPAEEIIQVDDLLYMTEEQLTAERDRIKCRKRILKRKMELITGQIRLITDTDRLDCETSEDLELLI